MRLFLLRLILGGFILTTYTTPPTVVGALTTVPLNLYSNNPVGVYSRTSSSGYGLQSLQYRLRSLKGGYSLNSIADDEEESIASGRILLEFDMDAPDAGAKEVEISSTGKEIISKRILNNTFTNFATQLLRRPIGFLRSVFLPVGYPQSVPQEYSVYQFWNILQDLCSYLRGVMSTQAILEGLGIGRSGVTSLDATINWIYRDGASLIGGLLFTSISSYSFGQNVKLWRLFADSINNVGITLDMLAPLFSEHFLIIVCIASICKALCGVAAGASGVAIAEHWGERNGNIADVLAKNNAQHTVVSLIGLTMSVHFMKAISGKPRILWATYGGLTLIHMISNYFAMRVLALRSLNRSRYDMLLQHFFSAPPIQQAIAATTDGPMDTQSSAIMDVEVISWLRSHGHLFTPPSIARSEPILSLLVPRTFRVWDRRISNFMLNLFRRSSSRVVSVDEMKNRIFMWVAPSIALSRLTPIDAEYELQKFDDEKYFIVEESSERGRIYVCIHDDADGEDHAKAIFEAYMRTQFPNKRSSSSRDLTKELFPLFWDFLYDQDWKCDIPQLRPKHGIVFQSKHVQQW